MKVFATLLLMVVLVTGACLVTPSANAQTGKLPPFRILQPGGKILKAEDLPAGKPVVLIYFSPDCDHCHVLMRGFFKHIKAFEQASVVMITFLPIDKVAQFSNAYKVQQYTNLFIGTEGTSFLVRNHYKMATMPFVALHNKLGAFVSSYSRDVPLDKVMANLKQL